MIDPRLPTTPTGMRFAHRWLGPGVLRRLNAEVTGREHVPLTGGVLVAANHRSFLDHYLLNAASPRVMWFLGKAELARGPLGEFNKIMGMIPVERGTADLQVLEMVADVLRAGEAVGIFPEGTRSPTGELFRFRSGLARLAASAKVPVVPVGLVGTAEVWPKGSRPSLRRPRPGQLEVHFGAAQPPPEATPRARRELTASVYAEIAALCRQPLADRFAPMPRGGTSWPPTGRPA